ncbi:hypothetical protein [Nonomuraea sp. SYSU D8015]|uniref:hypothetical protein n=1 Tax=Nonomuraea sp. SYSU D8015 TaxID=2593644 RepID=UPI0016611781|nr:hypothetical protein [Nonomuraea sp. SYSU D8015]
MAARLAAATAALVAAMVATVAAPPTAHAAAPCRIEIGDTTTEYDTVKGHGSISSNGCSAYTVTVKIWRSTWYGWKAVKSATVPGPGVDKYVFYSCAGTGRHDYKTVITADPGYAEGVISKTSNILRGVYCG